jgi:hypothetical protein
MRATLAALTLPLFLFASAAAAQDLQPTASVAAQPGYSAANCSGFITDQKVPEEIRLVSGEQSQYKIVFSRGEKVFINRGQDQGVRVGDRFMVVRLQKDVLTDNVNWFKWQSKLFKEMGIAYRDEGQVRVVNVQPKVSVAEVIFSCDFIQRGDILRPYVDRPAPPYKDATAFDHFAPVSGKPVGTIVGGYDNANAYGQNNTVYVNLGSAQGIKVGDYVRAFRYQGEVRELAPQTPGIQYMVYGFGGVSEKYAPKDLPRELLGEGIVLNVSRNSATVLITFSAVEMYAGNYVEIE